MAYNINAALNVKTADVNFIEAGIHENLSLAGIRAEKSVNGNNFLEIKLVNEAGATFTHTEYEPSAFPGDAPDKLQSKQDNQLSRILQLLKVYYSEEDLLKAAGELNSFEEMTQWVKRAAEAADKSKKLRVKVVYNEKGYTTLPKYAKYTFIEPMDVSATDSKIKQLAIDLFVRPIVADKEATTVSNPFAAAASTVSTTASSGLPF